VPDADSELTAVLAANRLLARYAHAVDGHDSDGVAGLFVADATLAGLPSGDLEGREAIRAFFAARADARDPSAGVRRHHVASANTRIDDDGVLRSTSYFNVVGEGGSVAGVYEDEFARDEGEWLLARRTVTVEHKA
jgi:uncharacterized protein (TIGR02246 family)